MREHQCLSSFLFFRFQSFFKLRKRERERGYIKLGIRRNSPKVTYLILMDSCGESFFFYGLYFYPEFLALVPTATNLVQLLTFLLSISADEKGSPLPFQGPSQSFGFSLLPPWPGDPLGILYVTPYPILFPSGHQVQTSVFPFWLGFVTLGLIHIPMMS